MHNILGMSDAASLGLHAMMLLARAQRGALLSVHALSGRLDASEAHLGKVLQRLGKAGLVTSRRGPGGGFSIPQSAENATLLAIYEAIEGELPSTACLLRRPACDGRTCVLGELLQSVSHSVHHYLSTRRLSDFRNGRRNVSLEATDTPLTSEEEKS